jgi:plastocyanin
MLTQATKMKIALTLCAAMALSACGLTGPAHDTPLPNAAGVIDMGFSSYTPKSVTIHVGDMVEWRNTSIITHTVTADSRHAKDPANAAVPSSVQPFDSGDIAAGKVFTHVFTAPGIYRYFCMHHDVDGMLGTITVLAKP